MIFKKINRIKRGIRSESVTVGDRIACFSMKLSLHRTARKERQKSAWMQSATGVMIS
jgi:hypothetical protein